MFQVVRQEESRLIRDCIVGDQIAVDMRPGLPSPRPRLTDPKALIYFFDRCYDLATNYPEETIKTAETFAIFATVSELYPTLLYR